jgi:hypothetical protein
MLEKTMINQLGFFSSELRKLGMSKAEIAVTILNNAFGATVLRQKEEDGNLTLTISQNGRPDLFVRRTVEGRWGDAGLSRSFNSQKPCLIHYGGLTLAIVDGSKVDMSPLIKMYEEVEGLIKEEYMDEIELVWGRSGRESLRQILNHFAQTASGSSIAVVKAPVEILTKLRGLGLLAGFKGRTGHPLLPNVQAICSPDAGNCLLLLVNPEWKAEHDNYRYLITIVK